MYDIEPIKWTPHAGQKRGTQFLLEHAAAGMLADPGVGKTSMVLAAFKILKARGLARRMLVVAPLKPCYLVWKPEVEKWSDFAHFKIEILHGPKKAEALARDADIYVINSEGLSWLLQATALRSASGRTAMAVDVRAFKRHGFDTLVIDELTRLKHTNSNRFKMLKPVLGTFARRWGLTGTPAPNGLIDLFGQCYVLDMGRSFGPFVTHFRNKYFLPTFDGFGWNLRKGAETEIYERLAPLALRLAAADYVDMPELVENIIRFDLPAKPRAIYDALERDMIAKIDQNTIVAANAASASIKCRQVVSGGIYLDPDIEPLLGKQHIKSSGREWIDLHDEKTDLLENLVEELQGQPLLVAYDFKHDLARLQKRFGQDVPYIGGGTSPRRAIELEKLWNAGQLPLLLGHPQSIGHGLNLQGAGNHVCWHSMTWDLELYDQFIRRVLRQGNRNKRVFVHHLLARNTIDETIYWALRNKARSQNALLDALKELRNRRK